ncbi:hypothetical protein BDP27DRAFT_306781 [Rhodocollybia butyracea]|uniref:Uncharacterized protein n=1 Tax=Rhodocollybia butyracea TaxID=206335 RepID=A0A9P5U162_9AGAR|nr:hypothetical protein BDP27DRAFT_306781 [Rhodocollybia butyracea]
MDGGGNNERHRGRQGKDRLFDAACLPAMQQTLCVLAHQALFDREAIQQWFPDVNVAYLGVTRTNWMGVWGEMETKKRYYDALNSLKQVRNMKFSDIIGGNHFLHWDQTPKFLQVICSL